MVVFKIKHITKNIENCMTLDFQCFPDNGKYTKATVSIGNNQMFDIEYHNIKDFTKDMACLVRKYNINSFPMQLPK